METMIGYALTVLFCAWLVVSTALWIWWHWWPGDEEVEPTRWRSVAAFGFLFGMFMLLRPGFETALFFIPYSYGADAEHDSLRRDLSNILAFLGSLGFFSILSATAKARRVQRRDKLDSAKRFFFL